MLFLCYLWTDFSVVYHFRKVILWSIRRHYIFLDFCSQTFELKLFYWHTTIYYQKSLIEYFNFGPKYFHLLPKKNKKIRDGPAEYFKFNELFWRGLSSRLHGFICLWPWNSLAPHLDIDFLLNFCSNCYWNSAET